MSIDTLTGISDAIYACKYLSRASLMLEHESYPFNDKEKVLEFVTDYLNEAIQGKKFSSTKDAVDYSHFNSLEPAKDSSKVGYLYSIIEAGNNMDSNTSSEALELLEASLTTLKKIKNNEQVADKMKSLSSVVLSILSEIQSSKSDQAFFNNNTARKTGYNLAI